MLAFLLGVVVGVVGKFAYDRYIATKTTAVD